MDETIDVRDLVTAFHCSCPFARAAAQRTLGKLNLDQVSQLYVLAESGRQSRTRIIYRVTVSLAALLTLVAGADALGDAARWPIVVKAGCLFGGVGLLAVAIAMGLGGLCGGYREAVEALCYAESGESPLTGRNRDLSNPATTVEASPVTGLLIDALGLDWPRTRPLLIEAIGRRLSRLSPEDARSVLTAKGKRNLWRVVLDAAKSSRTALPQARSVAQILTALAAADEPAAHTHLNRLAAIPERKLPSSSQQHLQSIARRMILTTGRDPGA